jgi:hypothetical protein
MLARHAVLLTPSKSARLPRAWPRGPLQLLSCKQVAPVTHLESPLVQVFILMNLKLLRMNTYEKHRGEGGGAYLPSYPSSPASSVPRFTRAPRHPAFLGGELEGSLAVELCHPPGEPINFPI